MLDLSTQPASCLKWLESLQKERPRLVLATRELLHNLRKGQVEAQECAHLAQTDLVGIRPAALAD